MASRARRRTAFALPDAFSPSAAGGDEPIVSTAYPQSVRRLARAGLTALEARVSVVPASQHSGPVVPLCSTEAALSS